MAEQKKKKIYGHSLIFLTLILLGVIIVTWGILWQSLKKFESGTPETAVVNFLKNVEKGNEKELPKPAISPYEQEKDYWAALKKEIEGIPNSREDIRMALTGEKDGAKLYSVFSPDGAKSVPLSLKKQDKKGYQVRAMLPEIDPVVIQAPAHVKIKINGQELQDKKVKDVPLGGGFEGLPEKLLPKLAEYSVSGLHKTPEITAVLPGGKTACKVTEENGVYMVGAPAAANVKADLEEYIGNVAKIYAKFVSNDATYYSLFSQLYEGTQFHKNISNFYRGWYVDHDSVSFENFRVEDVESVSEDTARGTVKFDYVVKKAGLQDQVFSSHYRVCVVKSGSGWKTAGIEIW